MHPLEFYSQDFKLTHTIILKFPEEEQNQS